jgi:uncharacterized protein (TIGR00251 family)
MEAAALISVRVQPRASADEVVGWQGETLRVRLQAPPVEGRANEALCRLLARRLGVPAGRVALVSGARGRVKRVRVEGMSLEEALRRLS